MEFLINGEVFGAGVPAPEEESEIIYEDADPSEIDPEGWRLYSDIMTPETIEYQKAHPLPEE